MARGGRISFRLDSTAVQRRLESSIAKVERGTRKATKAACETILNMSLEEVPEETKTLSSSAFYEIHGYRKDFTAVLGYGGNGDPVNPVTKQRASQYMLAVHEDLDAYHNKGKAKFLEDPIREYQSKFLPGLARIIGSELK